MSMRQLLSFAILHLLEVRMISDDISDRVLSLIETLDLIQP